MMETTALLVDEVLPRQPLHQWVLSVPFPLRFLFATEPAVSTGVHLHNTRGMGLANALAALEEGITTLDSSLGGLGGCPYAPGVSGNVVTEDLVFMLDAMGLKTGVDLDKLLRVRSTLAEALPTDELYKRRTH